MGSYCSTSRVDPAPKKRHNQELEDRLNRGGKEMNHNVEEPRALKNQEKPPGGKIATLLDKSRRFDEHSQKFNK